MYPGMPGFYLGVRTADCLPILFYNKQAGVVAVVHAGWQGTVQKIVQKAVNAISEEFDCPLGDFYFYFGPAARVCCYEITARPERVPAFAEYGDDVLVRRDGKIY